MNARVEFGWLSRPGRGRRSNQDRLVGYVPRDAALLARKGALFVVADGMQERRGGEVASHLAAQTVLRGYYANPSPDPVQCLQAAIGTADGWLRYWAAVRPDLQGMGTTLTAVVVRGGELIVAHVGDSRAYLVRSGRAWPLTRDHTWVADALARGLLMPQEAAHHPWRHILTRNLGGRSAVADVQRVAYAPGDRLVLCSDGVSNLLPPHEIAWLAVRPPHQAARELVGTTQRRGGPDDASAIVVALGQPAWQPRPAIRSAWQPVPPGVTPTPVGAVCPANWVLLWLGIGLVGLLGMLGLLLSR